MVDNQSTDNTEQIWKEWKFDKKKYLRLTKPHKLYAARNEGVKKSTRKYIAFLDVDDWWSKKKLEFQQKEMEKNGWDACWTGVEYFQMRNGHREPCFFKSMAKPDWSFSTLVRENRLAISSLCIRKETLIKYGLFNQEYEICGDYECNLKIALKGRAGILPKNMTKILLHDGSTSHRKAFMGIVEMGQIGLAFWKFMDGVQKVQFFLYFIRSALSKSLKILK